MLTHEQYQRCMRRLATAAVLVGLAALGTAGVVSAPYLVGARRASAQDQRITLPGLDYGPWRAVEVQDHGRNKPLESAVDESIRHITGSRKFDGRDPTALYLQWVLLQGTGDDERSIDWETYPFILCQDRDLRKAIYEHLPSFEELDRNGDGFLASLECDQLFGAKRRARLDLNEDGRLGPDEWRLWHDDLLHGKHISPQDLRQSPAFLKLVDEASEVRRKYRDSDVNKVMKPLQRKAEEVAGRLVLFDGISQNNPVIQGQRRERRQNDPVGVVALDRVKGGAWFSLGELRAIRRDQKTWRSMMEDRLARVPQLYISPERLADLKQFQEQIKAGTADKALQDLEQILTHRSEAKVEAFRKRHQDGDAIKLDQNFRDEIFGDLTDAEREQVARGIKAGDGKTVSASVLVREIRAVLAERDKNAITKLRNRVQHARTVGYHPDDSQFRMLHLDFLETKFPNIYLESSAWQEVPMAAINRVLDSLGMVQDVYRSGDADQFEKASQDYFATLREVSQEFDSYPGVDTIGMELAFNRIQPFRWAWIAMLLAALCFLGSMGLQSRLAYVLGFLLSTVSLLFQAHGFYVRVYISGRPPVSNMYETVIWVACMTTIFALVLELIYRRGVIALAGSLAATLGLILADQLPVFLDPKISPLTPVLRSNYWLTVHVLTIVSSYAGGALAWMLGNIALGILAFGSPRRETVKALSQFTYRAMQIAVLLLAAGTFLGGWWAAESWGRFWGWDPKEVWALISLVCYVIPLHARFVGWVKDFGLAVCAVLCFGAIVMSWYGVNFVLGVGLHSYGFGGGGYWWVLLATLLNLEWVILTSMVYLRKVQQSANPPSGPAEQEPQPAMAGSSVETRFKTGLGSM